MITSPVLSRANKYTSVILASDSNDKFNALAQKISVLHGVHFLNSTTVNSHFEASRYEHLFLTCEHLQKGREVIKNLKKHLPRLQIHLCIITSKKTVINSSYQCLLTTAFWISSDLCTTEKIRLYRKHFKSLRQQLNGVYKLAARETQILLKTYRQSAFEETFNVVMKKNYSCANFKTSDMAILLKISVSTLERKCLRYFGKLPKLLLMDFRLEQTLNDVLFTNISLAQIATTHGFRSSSYFSVKFHEKFGLTASQMRMQRSRIAS